MTFLDVNVFSILDKIMTKATFFVFFSRKNVGDYNLWRWHHRWSLWMIPGDSTHCGLLASERGVAAGNWCYHFTQGGVRFRSPAQEDTQQTRHIQPMLFYCWVIVHDADPTLIQHWFDVFAFSDAVVDRKRVSLRLGQDNHAVPSQIAQK